MEITGVSKTALITLMSRAQASQRSDALFYDEKAIQIVNKIKKDIANIKFSWITELCVNLRTYIVDNFVADFIVQHPNAVIVNLAAGFDTRFHRVDNGEILWRDIDFPQMIKLKRSLLEETDRYQFVGQSVLDFSWIDTVKSLERPLLIIAEGLLYYLHEKEVRTLFEQISTKLPHTEMVFDMLGPLWEGNFRQSRYLISQEVEDTEFNWVPRKVAIIQEWSPTIQITEEINIFDVFPEKWRYLTYFFYLFPQLKKSTLMTIYRLRM